jgi:DNA-binding CsgD family transcriptional regulator
MAFARRGLPGDLRGGRRRAGSPRPRSLPSPERLRVREGRDIERRIPRPRCTYPTASGSRAPRAQRRLWGIGELRSRVLGMAMFYNSDDHEAAAEFLREGLALNRDVGSWEYVAYCLEGFAGLAGARGEGVRSARLFGAAQRLREDIAAPLPPVDRAGYERSMVASRAQLDGATWEAAWKQGRAMSTEEAVDHALSEQEPHPSSPLVPEEVTPGEPTDALTRREQEIALLVARGLTNRQISKELAISERTAANPVAKILKKLGLRSRTQIASWATATQLSTTSRPG